MSHAIGKGIIELIQRHEPLALKGDGAAMARVITDLGDSAGGLLAFVLTQRGEEAAMAVAVVLLNRMRTAVPSILSKAEAEMAKRRSAMQ
jgi:acetyl esterase/lipase